MYGVSICIASICICDADCVEGRMFQRGIGILNDAVGEIDGYGEFRGSISE